MQTITRRSLGLLSASALAWMAVRKGLGSALREDSFSVSGGSRLLLREPVKVPRQFVGMHAHRWPAAEPLAPAPRYGFGTARSHDHDGLRWNQIHAAPGQFDWSNLDRWVAAHSAARRTLIYTLYGTPAWLAQDTTRADLYGSPGGASAPRDVAPLREFVATLLQRYNGAGRGIQIVETWNEPHFEGDSRDFWWDSAEQLVTVGRAAYTAAKSVDANVRVLSPGFVGDLTGPSSRVLPLLSRARHSSLVQYLTAADGKGGTGNSWCDGIAFHTYNVALHGENVGGVQDLLRLKELLRAMNLNMPLYNTECGFISPHPFRALRPAEQGEQLKRLGVLQAAMGVQNLCFYSHDDDFVGNPSQHPEIAAALDELHKTVAGATLYQVSLSPANTVQFTTEAGAFTW